MVGVPELGCHEELLALAEAILNRPRDAFADVRFVPVIARAIESAVPRRDGLVANFGTQLLRDLPKSEHERIRGRERGQRLRWDVAEGDPVRRRRVEHAMKGRAPNGGKDPSLSNEGVATVHDN
jgi:hypothetical protein